MGVTPRTVRNWQKKSEYLEERDTLSLMVGVSNKSYRLRISQKIIRLIIENIESNFDPRLVKLLLEWLKYSQGETDGIKLDLATLLEATSPLANS
ncbi:MAG: hypothetical protein ACPGWR_00930 [Ardenticatenaceae bacterium]